MATSTSRRLVGYNVQTAVDTQHHLIVAHEVINIGSDRRQLAKMVRQAKVAMATPDLPWLLPRRGNSRLRGSGYHPVCFEAHYFLSQSKWPIRQGGFRLRARDR